MNKTFKTLYSIQNTYRANSIVYYLKRLPFIGVHIPYSLYSNSTWKNLVSVFNIGYEIVRIFLFKFVYIAVLLWLVLNLLDVSWVTLSSSEVLLNMLLWCTIAGGITNCFVVEPKKDLQYAIIYLKMNANKVFFQCFFQFLVSSFIGFLPIYLLMPQIRALGAIKIISLLVILISVKLIGGALKICFRIKSDSYYKLKYSHTEVAIGAGLCAVGALLTCLNIAFNAVVVAIMALAFAVSAVFAFKYILNCKVYLKLYRAMYKEYDAIMDVNTRAAQITVRKSAEKHIKANVKIDINKNGYALLSECFVKRHKGLLAETTKKFIIGECLAIIMAIVACFILPDFNAIINVLIVPLLPMVAYMMCFLNCGERIVAMMFTNCDSEMLLFRFYRKPKAILAMFTLRLKTVVFMDWMQSMPIAVGLPLVLFASGGTEKVYEYALLFFTVMALSTFFSVHSLVVYYLFQPYDKDIQMKNPVYSIIKTVTYLVCFFAMRSDPPPLIFGLAVSAFSVIYILISIPIAYKVAPKTFKLR